MRISPELARDLKQAYLCSRETGGAFDPAVGPLVDAWGLRSTGRFPAEGELAAALKSSDPANFRISSVGIERLDPHARIEEGGFGKGVGLDEAASALRGVQIASATLDFGGQVLILGKRESEVSIASPEQRDQVLLTLTVGPGSISTSGNSEHGLKVGGREIGHILDPKTGRPAAFNGSVTVVAPTGAEADCLSTGLFVMGPEQGLRWIRDQAAGRQAVFLSRDSQVRTKAKAKGWIARASCGLKGRLKPVKSEVKINFDCES
jgi:thiamine biosynthesis lipoprotein